jgi:hypothetical protein
MQKFEEVCEVACLLKVGPSGLESLSWYTIKELETNFIFLRIRERIA